jgi:hypothetical protein
LFAPEHDVGYVPGRLPAIYVVVQTIGPRLASVSGGTRPVAMGVITGTGAVLDQLVVGLLAVIVSGTGTRPVRATLWVPLAGALDTMVKDADCAPVTPGLRTMVTLQVAPATMVVVQVFPVTAKLLGLAPATILILLMPKVPTPTFLTVIV